MSESSKLSPIKKVKDAVLYPGHIIKLLNVRASYPHLAEPYAGDDGGVPAFSIVSMLDKKTQKEAARLVSDTIKDFVATFKDLKIAKDKRCLKDGDDSDKTEAEGYYIVSAREKKRPKVRAKDGSILAPDEIDEVFYGGCYVDVIIRLWLQDNKYGKRVNANLVAVKFRDDGEAFGEGRINDESVWDDDDGFDDDDDDSDDDL